MQELSASQGQDMCVRGGPIDARGDGISGKRGKALGPGGSMLTAGPFRGLFFLRQLENGAGSGSSLQPSCV